MYPQTNVQVQPLPKPTIQPAVQSWGFGEIAISNSDKDCQSVPQSGMCALIHDAQNYVVLYSCWK